MKKRKNKLSNSLYKFRTIPDYLSHKQHRIICNQYTTEILTAKQKHWKDFLKEANEHEL
jgi:hypothetical protein